MITFHTWQQVNYEQHFLFQIKLSKNVPSVKLEKHFTIIWDTIKVDLLSRQKNEITELALMTIKCLMTNFSSDYQTCHNAVNIVLSATLPSISDINSTLFEANFEIICCCLNSSDNIALFVATKVVPILISQHRTNRQVKAMESIERVCDALEQQNLMTKLNHTCLDSLQNEIMYSLVHEKDSTILKTNLQIIQHVIKVMNTENRLKICSKLVELAANGTYSDLVLSISNTIISLDSHFNCEVSRFVLDPLKLLATSENPQTMKLLINLMFAENFKDDISEFTFKYIFVDSHNDDDLHIETLEYLVKALNKKKDATICTKITFIEEIISFIQMNPNKNVSFFVQCKKLLEILMERTDVDVRNRVVSKFLPQLEPEKKNELYILSGILGHENPSMDDYAFKQLSQKLIKISVSTKNKELQLQSNHLLCTLFNTSAYNVVTQNILDSLQTEVQCPQEQTLEVFSWISKALLIRGYEDYETIFNSVSMLFLNSLL